MKDNLSKMDLSRYANVILRVGGQDVDARVSKISFQETFQSLLKFLEQQGCKAFLSGLLPRGGTDMKSYNTILKDICQAHKVEFVYNHDFFVLASGELPYDYYHADKVNLRFPGIRKLVQNKNSACQILPTQSYPNGPRPNYIRNHNWQHSHQHRMRGNHRVPSTK